MDLLAVELVYHIQLYALSPSLPHVSTRLYHIFKSAPPSFHADYIIARVLRSKSAPLTRALRYPLCTTAVLDALCRHAASHTLRTDVPELPRRLFKHLTPRDPPLPFLAHLYAHPALRPPDANAHGGFALAQAVRAGCVPLVRFLLGRGADPGCRDARAVMAAIRRGDVALLRLLVERDGSGAPGKSKRRRLEDRVRLGPAMVRAAVECDARGIVEYLTKEKGCVPDMRTLTMAAEMAGKVVPGVTRSG